jgi:predicted TIM-barrel fold metal-dependent hydrolase
VYSLSGEGELRDVIDDVFVVDAVAHGLHFAPENQTAPDAHPGVGAMEYRRIHQRFAPRDRPKFVASRERWLHGADPAGLAHCLFAESQTDFAVYHGVPQWGVFRDGGSPLWVGTEMKRRWPDRVALYGPLNPWRPDALEELDRLVEEDAVVGVKFYPVDLEEGRIKSFRMNDHELMFPLYERARQLGLRSVAVHKAVPLGQFPTDPYRVDDVEEPAALFPDLTFEVVHGGSAFLEETAMLLGRFPNVVVNLEGTSAYLTIAPARFAQIIGTLLAQFDAEDRILWATGASAIHPQPALEAFWNLELPPELVEGYGLPELTRERKAKILGANAARLLGLDPEELRRRQADDEFGQRSELAAPWSSGETAAAA